LRAFPRDQIVIKVGLPLTGRPESIARFGSSPASPGKPGFGHQGAKGLDNAIIFVVGMLVYDNADSLGQNDLARISRMRRNEYG
jgi:hypothetical protein